MHQIGNHALSTSSHASEWIADFADIGASSHITSNASIFFFSDYSLYLNPLMFVLLWFFIPYY